ncbi:hypothetical protein [Agrobacterium vitis]|uniref:hypothetical protein n=1 Tax=Agrobacterium vitis TaxID=373 RepID=UPI001573CE56|nr:hypothetical protein [Agrobacterium vitis]NSZ15516.1 hypothetical protein [Agrobacterium vitis]QZO04364.1 hypothetical protein K4831_01975 [Agrobacterium vitis]UJL86507.1 hypothetical protein AVF2S5_00310 [Agrobacterium vitis]
MKARSNREQILWSHQFLGKDIGRNSIKYFENQNCWSCQAFVEETEKPLSRPLTPAVSPVSDAPKGGQGCQPSPILPSPFHFLDSQGVQLHCQAFSKVVLTQVNLRLNLKYRNKIK